ncbi:RNA polymerase sigma factor [Planctomycetaceae bacterium SH139]
MPIEPKALNDTLNRLWPVLVAWADRACEDPEDVVQAAFIKLAAEEPVPDNCVAWLFTVVKRLASNSRLATHRRKQRQINASASQPQQAERTEPAGEFELRDLLTRLGDREREIVIARVWGELSFEQLSVLFNEPKATVWRAYQTGIAKLKQVYLELNNDEQQPSTRETSLIKSRQDDAAK